MPTIDLIVLGMIKEKEQSAFMSCKRMLSTEIFLKWVKVSTPSIYKGNSVRRKRLYKKAFYQEM